MERLIGCLLIHGFTGSGFEVEPLTRHLTERGIHAVCPLLDGHGDNPEKPMKEVGWQDWVRSGEIAMQQLKRDYDTVYVIGFSMGGLIAAYLANRYQADKLVLLSASVFYLNPKQIVIDLANLMQSILKDSEQRHELRRYTERIKTVPLRAIAEFRRLVHALKPELHKITTPILIVQGALDDLVAPKSATYIYESVKSTDKHLHILPKSKHLVCHDGEQEQLIQRVSEFLEIN